MRGYFLSVPRRSKVKGHRANGVLGLMWYNVVKTHETPRITPVMAAGVTDYVWDAEDIMASLE